MCAHVFLLHVCACMCVCVYPCSCVYAHAHFLNTGSNANTHAPMLTHTWDAQNVIWSLCCHHRPVHVCAFAQCSYFQFSRSLHHCLRSVYLYAAAVAALLFLSFPFRFYNSIVGSNKSSSWQWQSARNTVSLQLKIPSIVFFPLFLLYAFRWIFRLNCLLCSWFLCHREFHRVDIFHLFSASVNSFPLRLPSLSLMLCVYRMHRPPMSAAQQQNKHVEKNLNQPFGSVRFGLNFALVRSLILQHASPQMKLDHIHLCTRHIVFQL